MLGSSARKERKQEKKLKKKEKKGTTGAENVSSVVSSSGVASAEAEKTHDSAQTIEAKAVSPIPESPGVVQSKKKDALNVSADSTAKASDSSSQTPLVHKSWFQILCGTAASIAILSTGTKLLMKKEENLEVKKQDVATPAAAGAGGKKRRGS